MQNKFYTAEVSKIIRETADSVAIEFKLPEEIIDDFLFIPGQYLTIKTLLNGKEVRRNYSICSAPYEGVLRVGIKELPGGKFSTYANRDLKEGDILDIMPPMGKFVHQVDSKSKHHYLGIACGSGITPVISIVKSILKDEPGSRFTLFYGNQTSSTIMFKEEIEGLKNLFLNRFSVYHILSREKGDIPLFEGRIDREKIKKFSRLFFSPDQVDGVFICGPGNMIVDISEQLQELGVPAEKIHFELFTTEGMKPKERKSTKASEITGDFVRVNLRIDGDIYNYKMPKEGTTLLDGAANTGADVPFACKGGVCSTCRAKLIRGKVDMEVNYALEPDELEQGFILTCQSYPLTDEIAVDFDIK
ncbi:MAG: phenylacetate-CoA oxygenase/reductase subunit PaaK [Saprospirales bacterium]|nr:MAG: phenylacetate-CoA oxygenase/reductase subunit PaaK [Saprospirales bacterium]